MAHEFPDLPYEYDALEPHISERTLRLHHDKHHRKYFDTTRDLIAGTTLETEPQTVIMGATMHDEKQRKLFNNVAQDWNHSFFWKCMSPDGGGAPGGAFGDRLESAFGGIDGFKEAFKTAAVDEFGSGWAWLVLEGDVLRVVHTSDALNPLLLNQVPLLTCDVWEHAYYLDYQNRRQEFVEAFLDNLVNWSWVEQQLDPDERMVA